MNNYINISSRFPLCRKYTSTFSYSLPPSFSLSLSFSSSHRRRPRIVPRSSMDYTMHRLRRNSSFARNELRTNKVANCERTFNPLTSIFALSFPSIVADPPSRLVMYSRAKGKTHARPSSGKIVTGDSSEIPEIRCSRRAPVGTANTNSETKISRVNSRSRMFA